MRLAGQRDNAALAVQLSKQLNECSTASGLQFDLFVVDLLSFSIFVVLLQMSCSMVAIVLVQFILWALCTILRKCPPLLFLFDFASENC